MCMDYTFTACRRESVANESIYSSKKSILLSNEVLLSICIPFSNEVRKLKNAF